MSIESQLIELNEIKSDILTSISNKGVTVPENAGLKDVSGLVDDIEAAGSYADLNNYPIVYDADVIQNLDLNLSNVGTIYIQDSILGYTEYDVPCQMLIDVDELCRKENKNNGTGGNAAKYNGTIKVQVVTKERADLLIEGGMMKDDFFGYSG